MDWDSLLFNRFLIAVPELNFDEDFIKFGQKIGAIGAEEAAQWRAAQRAAQKASRYMDKLTERTLMQRVMFLMPEVLSVTTINFLRRSNLISVLTANALRGALGATKTIYPVFARDATVLARMEAVFGAVTSNHWINLVRDLDDRRVIQLRELLLGEDNRLSPVHAQRIRDEIEASIKRAQRYRSLFSAADIAVETAKMVAVQRTVWGAITVAAEGLLSDRMMANAIRAGVIPPTTYDLIAKLDELGVRTGKYGKKVRLSQADRVFNRKAGKGVPTKMVTEDTLELFGSGRNAAMTIWKRGVQSFEYESWAARSLLIGEGILSPEMITFLVKAGFLDTRVAAFARPAALILRTAGRRLLESHMISRRYRVLDMNVKRSTMTPIQIYAAGTRRTEQEIITILRKSAVDARKAAEAAMLSNKVGAKATAAQQRAVVASVNGKMRELWETVGHLTIFGEKEAAQLALDSVDYMAKDIYGAVGGQVDDRVRSLQAQSRAGVDAFISREENILPLSNRVYGNMNLAANRVQLEVQKGLVRGLSAQDLAKNVAGLINPDVPGGVSYSAMRLARTEINNAFHFSQIRYTREQPWVDGYQWNLSGSHPKGQRGDPCADMASRNHDGIGRGVYKKANVPGKPHPLCLCYLTTVTKSAGEFERQLKRGSYDQYLAASSRQAFGAPHAAKTVRDGSMDDLARVAGTLDKLLAAAFISRIVG